MPNKIQIYILIPIKTSKCMTHNKKKVYIRGITDLNFF